MICSDLFTDVKKLFFQNYFKKILKIFTAVGLIKINQFDNSIISDLIYLCRNFLSHFQWAAGLSKLTSTRHDFYFTVDGIKILSWISIQMFIILNLIQIFIILYFILVFFRRRFRNHARVPENWLGNVILLLMLTLMMTLILVQAPKGVGLKSSRSEKWKAFAFTLFWDVKSIRVV